MTNWSGVLKQLEEERERVEKQLSALNAALTAFVGVYTSEPVTKGVTAVNGKRTVSAAARKKMSLAQKARWAKATTIAVPNVNRKRIVSASSRRKMAAAQRARWAKLKAGKKAA